MENLFIGVEIGATKIQAAIGDKHGRLISVRQGKVVLEKGAAGILDWMKSNVGELASCRTEHGGRVCAMAVGFGGIIETHTGKILTSVQVAGWKDFMLRDWFEGNFGLPAAILNDTVAGGYGEYIAGAGKGTKCFFYTNIGSGIGGAFIIDGKCYDGQGYGAAYFGHTYLPDWTSGKPGAKRKVEDLCSGWGIEKRLRSEGYVPAGSMIMEMCGGRREDISCMMLEKAARSGDTFAKEEIERIAESYATGLSNVITLFSPECVAIGGGVANMGDLLLEPVRRYAADLVFISSSDRYRIVKCEFGDQVVLVGSVLYAAREMQAGGGYGG